MAWKVKNKSTGITKDKERKKKKTFPNTEQKVELLMKFCRISYVPLLVE